MSENIGLAFDKNQAILIKVFTLLNEPGTVVEMKFFGHQFVF